MSFKEIGVINNPNSALTFNIYNPAKEPHLDFPKAQDSIVFATKAYDGAPFQVPNDALDKKLALIVATAIDKQNFGQVYYNKLKQLHLRKQKSSLFLDKPLDRMDIFSGPSFMDGIVNSASTIPIPLKEKVEPADVFHDCLPYTSETSNLQTSRLHQRQKTILSNHKLPKLPTKPSPDESIQYEATRGVFKDQFGNNVPDWIGVWSGTFRHFKAPPTSSILNFIFNEKNNRKAPLTSKNSQIVIIKNQQSFISKNYKLTLALENKLDQAPMVCSVSENQIILSNLLKADKKHWRPDYTVYACDECAVPFTFMIRRHHCRFCGDIFCHNCSKNRVQNVRICNGCSSQLT